MIHLSRPRHNRFCHSHEGVSLVMAIIFVSLFMLVLADLAAVQLQTIRSIGDRRNSSKARYLADAAEELGRKIAASHGPGWNSSDDPDQLNQYVDLLTETAVETGSSSFTFDLKVIGRALDNAKIELNGIDFFSAPAAYKDSAGTIHGTGDAAKCEDHATDNADDPCHWNKLYVGESVEIPLYYEGNETPNFSGAAANFSLRIRTPCDTEGFAPASNGSCGQGVPRVTLFPKAEPAESAYRDIKKDPVLVQWTISGTEAGESKTLIAKDGIVAINNVKKRDVITSNNTELYAGRINAATTNQENLSGSIVLKQDFSGTKISTNKTDPKTINGFIDGSLTRPVLRLSFVTQPTRASVAGDDNGDPYDPSLDANDYKYFIPFLEYQLLTKGPVPSDSKSTITGSIQFGEFSRRFKTAKQRETTLGGFVLESL